jgi:hypothetical protein
MNYYLTGIEGMPKLLDDCSDPMPYFKKNLYSSTFKRFYQENIGTFDAIENGYNSVIDKDQFLENMANALTEHAVELIGACKRKSEKEHKQMDLNMAVAVFVIPMVLEYKGNSSKPLSDKLLESWKKAFPKSNIQAAEFSFVEEGFHKKFCYITTAVCESFGRADDCYELTLLRDYRDTYLAASPEGEAMIREYYDVAPSIVKHIGQQESPRAIYRSIWDEYLAPCITMIEQGQKEECAQLYREMVYDLKDRYFAVV